ncbi:UNKNOWN [Stylonychia lemnae]|uniref:Uncharacterized protein n=1 Tax=Stylonychia lemnae TaxID=5949 RepID=A0A078B840_STYLE|nr:UNKNOWN [Stylonychia lemnae]|eukprot:CDW89447.1 UNKNOWN [Stylonychia lemnae]
MYYRDFDYRTIIAQNIQDFQHQGQTLIMDLYMVSLQGNTYNKNYAGNKEGLITGFGVMRIEFSKERFINNGENSNDLIPLLNKIDDSTFRLLEEDQSTANAQEFNYAFQATNDQGLSADDLEQYLLKSQIFLQSVSYVILDDIYSEGFINLQVQYSSDKGQLLYMEQFYGTMNIINNTVANSIGINNKYLTEKLRLFDSSATKRSMEIFTQYMHQKKHACLED